MGEQTKIEWCDYTFNPWIGCTKISPGCANCYAESDMDQRRGRAKWGPNGTRSKTSAEYWRKPLKWNREAEQFKHWSNWTRPRVFCASLADVFEDWDGPIVDSNGHVLIQSYLGDHRDTFDASTYGPWKSYGDKQGYTLLTMADLRRDLFALIDATPHLDWLLVTKRPENIRRMWPAVTINTDEQADDRNERGELHRRNVWLLTSVENQETYDERAHVLYHECRILVPVLGFSAEPLLGPIKLWHDFDGEMTRNWQGCFDWVIAGGESGPNARPMHPDWARSLRDQCLAASVPFFFKQLGEWGTISTDVSTGLPVYRMFDSYQQWVNKADTWINGGTCVDMTGKVLNNGADFQAAKYPVAILHRVGKKAAGRLLDGVLHDAFPNPLTAEQQKG